MGRISKLFTELGTELELYIREQTADSGGVSEDRVIELIGEHGGLDEETRARVNANLDRTEAALGELEMRMARRVGPTVPTGAYHTYPGWGMHLTAERPYRLGTATIEALTEGAVNFELIEYDGNAGDLVDETEVRVPRGEDPLEIDLDMRVPEGEFLLTRDWINPPPENERVSLRRQQDYVGWGDDSGDGLTFHGSGHDEYADNKNWYYLFDLGVSPTGGF